MVHVPAKHLLIGIAGILAFSGCRHVKSDGGNPLELEMVPLNGGTFTMGDLFDRENDDALPVHEVRLKPFRLSKFEVTFEQYDAFALETGRALPPDDGYGRGRRAVVHVSWNDAKAFCENQGYRLPSEAEWEYAARGGGLRHRYAGTNRVDELPQFAYYGDNSAGFSAPVGMKEPNGAGLHDMTGNVAEWVGDYYEFYPENGEKPLYKDLDRPGMRIIRGGNFTTTADPPANVFTGQTFWRAATLDDTESFTIGFRCAD